MSKIVRQVDLLYAIVCVRNYVLSLQVWLFLRSDNELLEIFKVFAV